MKSWNRIAVSCLIGGGCTLLAASAFGDVAYTTLAADGSFVGGGAVLGSGSDSEGAAFSFVPTITGDLSSIQVAIDWRVGYATRDFHLSLMANNPGGGPLTSAVLLQPQTVTSTGLFGLAPYNNATLFTYSGPELTLSAGTTYWLAATVDTGTSVVWCQSLVSIPAMKEYFSFNGGATYSSAGAAQTAAFQVNVTPAPEPTTMTLFGAALLGVCATARRRQARG